MLRKFLLYFVFAALWAALTAGPALADCGPGAIVLDPGHGGWDSGAVGPTGFTEKAANLDIAQRARNLLTKAGYHVIMTRDSDLSPNSPAKDLTGDGAIGVADDLQARVNIANRAQGKLFISIHNNAALSSAARGTETYYWSGSSPDSDSGRLAKMVQREITAQVGLLNRGVKGANFYVLRRTNMPAALVEGAFISNPIEELLLKSPQFRQKLAVGIYNGIRRYAGVPIKNEPTLLKRKLKPNSRVEIDVNRYLCDKSAGARVIADVPVVAERTMYFNTGARSGGSTTLGTPKPSRTWFFAEGSTSPGFDTWLLLSNATARKTTVRIKYMTETGSRDGGKVVLQPFGRRSIHVNPALPNRSLGIMVTAARPIAAERSVYFNYRTFAGGHTTIGARALATNWYFADGSTAGDSESWLSLLNPGLAPAEARLTYITPAGPVDGGTVAIPPRRRRSINVAGAVSQADTAIIVRADRGIVAERAAYFDYNGVTGGAVSIGARRLSTKWYFAEGDTRSGRTEFLTLLNPSDRDADVTVDYLPTGAAAVSRRKTVPAGSQLELLVNGPEEVGQGKRVAVRLAADTPIAAERRMYYDFSGYTGGDSSIGAPAASKRWYFAEGFTGGGFTTRLVISNPSESEANIKVRFLK